MNRINFNSIINSKFDKSLNQNSKNILNRLSPNPSENFSKKVSEERFSKVPSLNSGNANTKSLAELKALQKESMRQ